MLASKVGNNAA